MNFKITPICLLIAYLSFSSLTCNGAPQDNLLKFDFSSSISSGILGRVLDIGSNIINLFLRPQVPFNFDNHLTILNTLKFSLAQIAGNLSPEDAHALKMSLLDTLNHCEANEQIIQNFKPSDYPENVSEAIVILTSIQFFVCQLLKTQQKSTVQSIINYLVEDIESRTINNRLLNAPELTYSIANHESNIPEFTSSSSTSDRKKPISEGLNSADRELQVANFRFTNRTRSSKLFDLPLQFYSKLFN